MPGNEPLRPGKMCVLIVDDDKDLRRMIRMVLEDEDVDVLEAKNGRDALTILNSSSCRLVVLLDWMMPDMSGEETLEAIRADHALARRHAFVLLTANAALLTPHMNLLLDDLSAPLLAKPFSIQDLLTTVENQAHRIQVEEAS